jgi:hypothetical protein
MSSTMPFERPTPDLRASDADREATVERLRVAAVEGRLDADELEERLTAAYAARWCSELERLTRDVTPPPPRPVRPTRMAIAPYRRPNALAVASLVAAFLWHPPVTAFAAIILGHLALARIRRSGGMYRGRGLATLGLALGYFELIVLVLVGTVGWALH